MQWHSRTARLALILPLVLLGSSLARAAEVTIAVPEAVVHSAPFDVAPELGRVHVGDTLTGNADAQPGWLRVRLPDDRLGFVHAGEGQLRVEPEGATLPRLVVSAPATPSEAAVSGKQRLIGLAIHPEVGFLLPTHPSSTAPNSTPGIASAGLGVGYDVRSNIQLEATVSTTASSYRATKDARGNVDYGTIIRALVHWHRNEVGWGPLLGVGPAMITGGNFGTVPLVHAEGGVEFRSRVDPHSRVGVYFAAAYQLVEPLRTSAPDVDPTQCVTRDCPSRFNPSDPIFGVRAAFGLLF